MKKVRKNNKKGFCFILKKSTVVFIFQKINKKRDCLFEQPLFLIALFVILSISSLKVASACYKATVLKQTFLHPKNEEKLEIEKKLKLNSLPSFGLLSPYFFLFFIFLCYKFDKCLFFSLLKNNSDLMLGSEFATLGNDKTNFLSNAPSGHLNLSGECR